MLAAAISRYASLIDGLAGSLFRDPDFERIVRADLFDGQHRNDTGRIEYFTTAFFHRPDELSDEIRESGLRLVELVAVEGVGAVMPDFETRWKNPAERAKLVSLLQLVEAEPAILGVSPHLLAVAQR